MLAFLTLCIAEQRWFFISFHIADGKVKDCVRKAPKIAVYMFLKKLAEKGLL